MTDLMIPVLSKNEVDIYFKKAHDSIRHREAKILHEKGDYLNKVFNFLLRDTYMHPHMHPSEEKIEKMYLVRGSFALIIFDDNGVVVDLVVLEKGQRENINVPAHTWHTYVMMDDEVIVFETMEGFYDPSTWKKMAPWAPEENTDAAHAYLASLKELVQSARNEI